MKYDDAKSTFLLEHCAERCDGYQKDDACENCEIDAAIEALDKQIPFTPETNNLKAENFVGGRGMTELKKCPFCGSKARLNVCNEK